MSDAPDTVEYVLQPIASDRGEIAVARDGDPLVVDVSVTDLADGLTLIAIPEGLDREVVERLAQAIEERAAKDGGQFVVVEGDTSQWRFAKLIRKDHWDADYRERA